MGTKAPCTILFITRQAVIRADFKNLSAERILRFDRDGTLPERISEALTKGGARPHRKVWILSTELSIQIVQLPTRAVIGLPPEELGRSLAFELEPITGIPADDSAEAFVSLAGTGDGDMRAFWVTQSSKAEYRKIIEAVRKAGGHVEGMLHPAGMPVSILNPTFFGKMQRVELWTGSIFCLHRDPAAASSVRILHEDYADRRWVAGVQQWLSSMGEVEYREVLIPPAAGAHAATAAGTIAEAVSADMQDDAVLSAWMLGWAREFDLGERAVPIIAPPPKPVSRKRRVVIGTVLFLIAVLLCGAHFSMRLIHYRELKEQTGLSGDEQKLKTEQESLVKEIAQFDRDHKSLKSYRSRFAGLLTLIAERSTNDLVITEIVEEKGDVVLRGGCLNPSAVDRFAAALGRDVVALGWQSGPAKKQSRTQDALWIFEVRLQDIVPGGGSTSAAPEKVVK
jgi:hypothetical protein